MRLTHINLHASESLEDIELSVREGSFGNRYIVRSIVGIDAEDIVPKFQGFGAVSGNAFYDRVLKPRDIVMRIGLNPKYAINESVSDIRDDLYKLIAASRSGIIRLEFKSGGVFDRVISGMITKFEAAYFDSMPVLQVTFNCADPLFRSPTPVVFDAPNFPGSGAINIPDNSSTAPHGFSFKAVFTDPTPNLKIQDVTAAGTPDWFFNVIPTGGFAIGDEYWFSSEYGQKLVYHEKAAPVHLMDKIEAGSVWPMIFPGNNPLYFVPLADIEFLEFSYYSAYWGV